MNSLTDMPVQTPSLTESMALLTHVTSTSPSVLSGQERNILSDLFPSLRCLSQAVRTLEGWEVLIEYLGKDRAQEITEFWNGDTTCE
ncbi:hypothetical protein BDV29DRAFT_181440 [Aspergillus leporis]|jgi:hypothetical protein|uniref:Uncharacterized protein n=1 Tax=Aspergillus leporis TaxID=41062 RepID=A0A5N5WNT6_9EURO|nr:hypothetical protein BDV29DRAFT_181440 [Aspergillus leporis]